MIYKKDERGEYRATDRWIDAWTGEHGFPGYCLCELREYADGRSMVWRSEARYLNDHDQDALAHNIYLRTRAYLITGTKRKEPKP